MSDTPPTPTARFSLYKKQKPPSVTAQSLRIKLSKRLIIPVELERSMRAAITKKVDRRKRGRK